MPQGVFIQPSAIMTNKRIIIMVTNSADDIKGYVTRTTNR
jgi:hypothetical protein